MGTYVLTAVLGLVFSAWAFERAWGERITAGDRSERSPVPVGVFLGALVGFVVGAKLGFVLCEGLFLRGASRRETLWLLVQGKTVTGALLGGYIGVEWAKRLSGYSRPTGDGFALMVPAGLMLGRLGCLRAGCCLGVPIEPHPFALIDAHGIARFPSVPLELLFNAAFLAWAWAIGRHRERLRGQLFHIYLITYGLFRLLHEPLRATPKLAFGISGYQLLALAIVLLGATRLAKTHRTCVGDTIPPSNPPESRRF